MELIYLDNGATTKPIDDIFRRNAEYYFENFYNPSANYESARDVKKQLDKKRAYLEGLFKGKKLLFTSCGTEADNTAIFSFGKRGNVVTTLGEHSAVYKCFEKLRSDGMDVRYAKLKFGGAVDVDDLLSRIDDKTTFVSVVHVNNETGAVNDVNAIAKLIKAKNPKIIFHSDGVQAFGKIKSSLENVDLYSVSAHKIGGLKGVGGLFFRNDLHVKPLILGGGQESGLRSGTENVLGVNVFADCAEYYYKRIDQNFDRVKLLKQRFLSLIDDGPYKIISPVDGSPYIVSISAVGLKGQVLQSVLADSGVIVGTGSACSSKSPFSRIISSFERDKKVLDGVLRISFCPETTAEEVDAAAKILNEKTKYFNGII